MFVFLGLVPQKSILPCVVFAVVVKAEARPGRHTEMMSQAWDVASGQRSPGVLN